MKKYIAIGHFDDSKNMTSVACKASSMKNFRQDCGGNGFIPWVVISENKMEVLKNADCMTIFDEVKKLTTNYRVWNDVTEYIEQCLDIMEEKLARA